jgi:hypothetical protein
LPSQKTQALQPLDRSFFKHIETYYNEETIMLMRNQKVRHIARYQLGEFVGKDYGKAAAVSVGSSGFKVTGLFLLKPNVIPNHFFSIRNNSVTASVETEPHISISTSNKSKDPETSASSATDGIDTYTALKHLEICPIPKIHTAFSKRMKVQPF